MSRVECTAELLIMALDPRYYAVRDLIPHGLVYDATECTKLTQARNTTEGAGTGEVR